VLRTCAVLVGILLFTSSFTSFSNVYSEESTLPEWVKNIFVWFGEGVVSEGELLGAIEWLIENNVIKIKQISENDEWKEQASKLYKENQELEEDVVYWKKKYETYHENLLKLDARFKEYINEQKGSSSTTPSLQDILSPTVTSLIVDKGDLKVFYGFSSDDYITNTLKPFLKSSEGYLINPNTLNNRFAFPYDVKVMYEECKETNAYYNPSLKKITICYELVEHFVNFYKGRYSNDATVLKAIEAAIHWVFLHEFAHALISIHNLPIVGMEEDAADQLSTVLLLVAGTAEGQGAMSAVTMWFLEQGVSQTTLHFWDNHALSMQRFFNLLCWMYGSDPTHFSWIVNDGALPKERAVHCQGEYDQMKRGWADLLSKTYK